MKTLSLSILLKIIMNNIETKLQQLRVQWTKYPSRRSAIELQVKMLKLGSKYPEYVKADEPFINKVRKALV